ncbi:hypothetical protein FNV43_RR22634 [Rhamnella rubrinervis]|uniref:Uncharacterized protein n=1 Tax=Rhamnella rubrinervis TaxID=2594499 RepID=A0A8K0DQU0_9ROSA|nr:hypothetical protein FNV43_RR22634 [Rhamnella rubrinervis]
MVAIPCPFRGVAAPLGPLHNLITDTCPSRVFTSPKVDTAPCGVAIPCPFGVSIGSTARRSGNAAADGTICSSSPPRAGSVSTGEIHEPTTGGAKVLQARRRRSRVLFHALRGSASIGSTAGRGMLPPTGPPPCSPNRVWVRSPWGPTPGEIHEPTTGGVQLAPCEAHNQLIGLKIKIFHPVKVEP